MSSAGVGWWGWLVDDPFSKFLSLSLFPPSLSSYYTHRARHDEPASSRAHRHTHNNTSRTSLLSFFFYLDFPGMPAAESLLTGAFKNNLSDELERAAQESYMASHNIMSNVVFTLLRIPLGFGYYC